MDTNSMKEHRNIHDLKDVLDESANGNNQEVIVIDGRGYENNPERKEIFTLVEVIEDAQAGDHLYEEILKRAEEIAERIARKMVPQIAERIIKEEIDKLREPDKKTTQPE